MRELAKPEAAAYGKKYAYKICPRRWNPKERKYDGCGKHFTADSFLSACPECGQVLSIVLRDSHPPVPVPRVIFEECVKCDRNTRAFSCLGGFPGRPEECGGCACRKCCEERDVTADRVWDEIRRAVNASSREKVNHAPTDAAWGPSRARTAILEGDTAPANSPRTGSGRKTPSAAKSIGEILEDDIPF